MVSIEKDMAEVHAGRLGKREILYLCSFCSGAAGNDAKEILYAMSLSGDTRVSYNVLWAFTHFRRDDVGWLQPKRDELIDRAMAESHVGKRRLILTLLSRLDFDVAGFRSDFLDFCLTKMLSQVEPYGVRALSLRLAFAQCRWYPELLSELESAIDMMESAPLSPGLKSAIKDIRCRVSQLNKSK
ncbi:MAG: hypothetical protein K2I64_03370 [Muribaculaceae bacterium]|nr:hypothetical protein [Muribaculaceae bacterium]